MGKKTKIDWCDASYSPITGCFNGCKYCYAKRIAERFAGFDTNNEENRRSYSIVGYRGHNLYGVSHPMTRITKEGEEQTAVYPFGFNPTIFSYKLNELQQWKEPKDIFVCSMADLFGAWIPDTWIARIFDACEKAPQHRYFFLTKNPQRYIDLFNNLLTLKKPHDNWWFGTTVTEPEQPYFFRSDANCFLSIEPIHADFPVDDRDLKALGIKWIIVGAETGNRVGKVKPEREWIEHIIETCKKSGIPLFMKDSVEKLMGKEFRQVKP